MRQKRHELPLRPARILTLVDQHVVIARLQPVSALGELLHLPQQVQRPQQQLRVIQRGVRVEGAAVLGVGDAEHPPDAPRDEHVHVAAVIGEDATDGLALLRHQVSMHAPVGLVRELCPGVRHAGAGGAFPREEMLAGTREGGLHGCGVERTDPALCDAKLPKVAGQHGKRRREGAGPDEGVEPTPPRVEQVDHRGRRAASGALHVQVRWPDREVSKQHTTRDDSPMQERGEPRARPPLAELRKHERHVLIVAGTRLADAQRPVERFVDQPRHLRLVQHREAGIQVSFERKFAQQ